MSGRRKSYSEAAKLNSRKSLEKQDRRLIEEFKKNQGDLEQEIEFLHHLENPITRKEKNEIFKKKKTCRSPIEKKKVQSFRRFKKKRKGLEEDLKKIKNQSSKILKRMDDVEFEILLDDVEKECRKEAFAVEPKKQRE